ncbi:MAG: GIY-YIG catalytic domain protein [Candidatus Izimaplasma bacterium HR2]|nr:MAG: GIY-YIG catalytic domain protein [Candidatus Izimaplasma bacterium HR2]
MEKKVGYIYKIANKINSKVYIGKTYHTIENRFKQHINSSKRNKCKTQPLYLAINKYGIENFIVEEIGKYEEGLLEEMEIEFIAKYNSYHNGYNATLGGEGVKTFSYSDKEVIEKYKELEYIHKTAEYFNCCRNTICSILKRNSIRIKHAHYFNYSDEEVIEKYAELKYLKKTAEYFDCCKDTIREVLKRSNIKTDYRLKYTEKEIIVKYKELKFVNKTAKYFECCEKTIRDILNKNGIDTNISKPKRVVKLDKNTLKILEFYDSISDAARKLGNINKSSHISQVCKGKRKTAYGYK